LPIGSVSNLYENPRIPSQGNPEEVRVAVPRGEMAETVAAAEAAAKNLFGAGATGVVVKAQIHAGGRGKGGGVKIAKSVEEASSNCWQDSRMTLVTHQTGPEVASCDGY
jgi:succinyl-CoA synthetase beta subunit